MTNKEQFNTFVSKDFNKVKELLDKGYTETSEFKLALEMLDSSIDAMLQDMDLQEKEAQQINLEESAKKVVYGPMYSGDYQLDEIEFGKTDFEVEYEGRQYLVSTEGGKFYGYADVKDGKLIKWETDSMRAEFTFKVKVGEEYIPFKADPEEFFDPVFDKAANYLEKQMTEYLLTKYIKEVA